MQKKNRSERLRKFLIELLLVIIPLVLGFGVLYGTFQLSPAICNALIFVFLIPITISALSGLIRGLLFRNWTTLSLTWKINTGVFISEPNLSFGKRLRIILSKFFWEQPQTYLGNFSMHLINSVWLLERGDKFKNTFVLQGYFFFGGGIALGSYIFIDLKDKSPINLHPMDERKNAEKILIRHEYGHYIQSKISGPLFIFKYGIPSVVMQGWTETDCDMRSDKILLLEEQIMPIFTYPKNLKPVKPRLFEFLVIVVAISTGYFFNEMHGVMGSSLIAMVVISMLNLKKPL